MTAPTTEGYEGDKGDIIQFAVNPFNRKYKPTGTNWVTLFRLTYYKTYVQQGLRYQMQMTLAKTNCTTEKDWLNAICTPVPNTASIRLEIGIQSILWANVLTVTHVFWTKHNCTKPFIPIRARNRDCIANQPPIPVHPLTDVNHCVHFRAAGGLNIGESKCVGRIISVLTPSSLLGTPLNYIYASLPEQVSSM